MNAVKLFFISLLLSSVVNSFAQKDKADPNELDNLYVPPKNSIFNQGDGSTKSSTSDDNNAIKFNPILITRSIGAIFYERWIIEGISVQGGLGVCLGKDIMMSAGSMVDLNFTENSASSLSIADIMELGKFNSGGDPFISLAFRFFWGGYYDLNNYFELGFRNYVNNLKVSGDVAEYSDKQISGGSQYVTVKNSNFLMTYGYQAITGGKVGTVHDFYIGFGLRNTSFDSFKSEEVTKTDSWGNQYTVYEHKKTGVRERILAPAMVIGYAFGFLF